MGELAANGEAGGKRAAAGQSRSDKAQRARITFVKMKGLAFQPKGSAAPTASTSSDSTDVPCCSSCRIAT